MMLIQLVMIKVEVAMKGKRQSLRHQMTVLMVRTSHSTLKLHGHMQKVGNAACTHLDVV